VREHSFFGRACAMSLLGLVALMAALLAGCGGPSASASSGAVKHEECTAVANVLSDGPDPDADPIGYAEAQVLPLRQLRLSDLALREAVERLEAAYARFSADDGAQSTRYAAAVSVAEKGLNKICPGAAP
jgi:hypothetical protein